MTSERLVIWRITTIFLDIQILTFGVYAISAQLELNIGGRKHI